MPHGRAYTVSSYRDPGGCLIAERWIIHGAPHAWPGGTTDEREDEGEPQEPAELPVARVAVDVEAKQSRKP